MGAAQSILNDKADTEFAVGVSLAVTTFAAIGALIGSTSTEILKGRAVLRYGDGAVSLLGLVGTLGVVTFVIKMVFNPSELKALGITTTSPMRGTWEAIKAMSPNDNLFALGNKFIMEQGVYEPVGRFEQRTSSLLVEEYTTNEDPTVMEYHQNMLWLGERSAAYIDCYACVRFNNTIKCRLIKTFFFESFAAIAVTFGLTALATADVLENWPMWLFAGKGFLSLVSAFRFYSRTKILKLDQDNRKWVAVRTCNRGNMDSDSCSPYLIQTFSQSNGDGYCATRSATVYSRCAYRVVQGTTSRPISKRSPIKTKAQDIWIGFWLVVAAISIVIGYSAYIAKISTKFRGPTHFGVWVGLQAGFVLVKSYMASRQPTGVFSAYSTLPRDPIGSGLIFSLGTENVKLSDYALLNGLFYLLNGRYQIASAQTALSSQAWMSELTSDSGTENRTEVLHGPCILVLQDSSISSCVNPVRGESQPAAKHTVWVAIHPRNATTTDIYPHRDLVELFSTGSLKAPSLKATVHQ